MEDEQLQLDAQHMDQEDYEGHCEHIARARDDVEKSLQDVTSDLDDALKVSKLKSSSVDLHSVSLKPLCFDERVGFVPYACS